MSVMSIGDVAYRRFDQISGVGYWRGMAGRPQIGKSTPVRFAPDVLARIDAAAGPQRRAQFIRDAVAQALDRAEAGDKLKQLAADPVALYAAITASQKSATKIQD